MTKFPLAWPQGWRRTEAHARTRAKFSKGTHMGGPKYTELTVADGVRRVLDELRRFGVLEGDAILSTNLRTRLDGLPRGDQPLPQDPGAAVYWTRHGDAGTKVMAIDRYDRVEHNLAAIAATLDAMRAIERHGGARILDRAFAGFAALPAPAAARAWWEVLDVPPDCRDAPRVKEAYRRAASAAHPDRKDTGSHAAMAEVNQAWAEFNQLIGGT